MSQSQENRAALSNHCRSSSPSQLAHQLFSWWPYLFVMISVVRIRVHLLAANPEMTESQSSSLSVVVKLRISGCP
jgi:hypothetical protein